MVLWRKLGHSFLPTPRSVIDAPTTTAYAVMLRSVQCCPLCVAEMLTLSLELRSLRIPRNVLCRGSSTVAIPSTPPWQVYRAQDVRTNGLGISADGVLSRKKSAAAVVSPVLRCADSVHFQTCACRQCRTPVGKVSMHYY